MSKPLRHTQVHARFVFDRWNIYTASQYSLQMTTISGAPCVVGKVPQDLGRTTVRHDLHSVSAPPLAIVSISSCTTHSLQDLLTGQKES